MVKPGSDEDHGKVTLPELVRFEVAAMDKSSKTSLFHFLRKTYQCSLLLLFLLSVACSVKPPQPDLFS